MAETSTLNSDNKVEHNEKEEADGIKKEVEVSVKREQLECVVCAARCRDCRHIYGTNTAASGSPLHHFLNKYTSVDLASAHNCSKYICKSCLDLINVLEQAEIDYLKLKETFEAIISKNPLFEAPLAQPIRLSTIKVELDCNEDFPDDLHDDSDDEPLATRRKQKQHKVQKKKKKVLSSGTKRNVRTKSSNVGWKCDECGKQGTSGGTVSLAAHKLVAHTLTEDNSILRDIKTEDSAEGISSWKPRGEMQLADSRQSPGEEFSTFDTISNFNENLPFIYTGDDGHGPFQRVEEKPSTEFLRSAQNSELVIINVDSMTSNAEQNMKPLINVHDPNSILLVRTNDHVEEDIQRSTTKNEVYITAKRKRLCDKTFIGNDFKCNCYLKCTEKLSGEVRKNVFDTFCNTKSYEARCALLQKYVKEIKTKNKGFSTSEKVTSRQYFINNLKVCKKAFLNTFNIRKDKLDYALKRFRPTKKGKIASNPKQVIKMRQFIDEVPKYISHYTKERDNVKYLSPHLDMKLLYDLYQGKHPDGVSLNRFQLCLYLEFNIRAQKQKYTCLQCGQYKTELPKARKDRKQLLAAQNKEHWDDVYAVRAHMQEDIEQAKIDPSLDTLSFDLAQPETLPRLPLTSVYNKRQFNLYNLSIHCGSSGKDLFNVWLEHEGGRGTQEVGSCLRKYIQSHLKRGAVHLILWADSHRGQNRNMKMVLLLLYIVQNHDTLQTITLKFIPPGHRDLPNESGFNAMKSLLKTQTRLYTVEDFIQIMKTSPNTEDIAITRMNTDDFRSIAPIEDYMKGYQKHDSVMQNISLNKIFEVQLRKVEPFKIFVKENLLDEPKAVVLHTKDKSRKNSLNCKLPVLYPNGRELSTSKVDDLRKIIKLLPADVKQFYSFLNTARTNNFCDDVDGFGQSIDFEIEES